MKKLGNKGFSIVEGILILVIVGIIGGTIFYVHNANKKIGSGSDGTTIAQSNKAESSTGTQTKAPAEDPNKGYLVVKEWNIRIKFRDADKVTRYSYIPESGDIFGEKYDSYISPVIKPYNDANKDCKDLGLSMYRSKTKFTGETKKVGDYYFLATGSPGQCADQENDPDNALHSRLIEDFNAANVEVLP